MGTLGQRWRCPKVAEPTPINLPKRLEGQHKRTESGDHINFITRGVARSNTNKGGRRESNKQEKPLLLSKPRYPQA